MAILDVAENGPTASGHPTGKAVSLPMLWLVGTVFTVSIVAVVWLGLMARALCSTLDTSCTWEERSASVRTAVAKSLDATLAALASNTPPQMGALSLEGVHKGVGDSELLDAPAQAGNATERFREAAVALRTDLDGPSLEGVTPSSPQQVSALLLLARSEQRFLGALASLDGVVEEERTKASERLGVLMRSVFLLCALGVVSTGVLVVLIVHSRKQQHALEGARTNALQSAEGYRTMFEENRSVLLLIDPAEDQVVDANPAACRFYGYAREALRGRPMSTLMEFVPSRPGPGNPHGTDSFEVRHRNAGGELHEVEIHTSPIQVGGRDLQFAVVHNLTERRRAEARLQEQRRKFIRVLDRLDEGIFRTTPGGRFLFANTALARLLGYRSVQELKDAVPESAERLYAKPAFRKQLQRELEVNGAVQGFEFEAVRKDGTHVWLSEDIRAVRNREGRVIAWEGAARDVTARRQAERSLAVSEERYRTLFQSSPLPMWVFDLDTLRILDVNDAAISHYGYSVDEFLGMTIREIRPPEDLPILDEALRHVQDDNRPSSHEVRHRKKDGTVINVEVTARPVKFNGSRARLVVANDVTENHLLQAQLIQAQKMEAVGRLAGGIAHDFNNMLTAILGFSDLTLQKLDADHSARPYVQGIRAAGERSASLTRQLLLFSRKQVAAKKVVSPNLLLEELEKILPRVLGEDVRLEIHLAPDAGTIEIDPSHFEQVIMNLAVNARDAMPRGGKLVIETCNVTLDESYCRNRLVPSAGPHVMISVSDDGCGMDEATITRMFEPFFTTKGEGKGTGLGLATVYGIVKDSGGGIWARSALGRGTAFKVCFPCADKPGTKAPEVHTDANLHQGDETVLIVEDEPMVRRLSREALTARGYQVVEAPDGHAALELLRALKGGIDLLVTDVVMPGMRGQELVERARGICPGLKALLMSGYTNDMTFVEGVSADRPEFLQKPFLPVNLAQRVRFLLDADSAGGAETG